MSALPLSLRPHAALLGVVLWLTACATPTKVQTDFDTSADFSRLRTYSWLETPPDVPRDPRIDNDLLHSRVRSAVNDGLLAKGYTEASESPDFRVTYHVKVRDRLDVQTFSGAYGYGLGRWPDRDVRVSQYEEGMLLLDFVDSASNELIWRGSAQADIDPNRTPQERTKLIRRAVDEMLERFPPKR